MRTSDAHRREARLMQWLLQSFFTQQQYSVQSKPWTEWGHRWLSTIWELCHNVPYTKRIFTTTRTPAQFFSSVFTPGMSKYINWSFLQWYSNHVCEILQGEALSHWMHWNGFCPVWVLWCLTRSPLGLKALPHWLHC